MKTIINNIDLPNYDIIHDVIGKLSNDLNKKLEDYIIKYNITYTFCHITLERIYCIRINHRALCNRTNHFFTY